MLSREILDLARHLGIERPLGLDDRQFQLYVLGIQAHRSLRAKAQRLGATQSRNLSNAQLRELICQRLIEILREQGFVREALVRWGDQILRITTIQYVKGPTPSVKVIFWIESPWHRDDNRGRGNHCSAEHFLTKAVLIQ